MLRRIFLDLDDVLNEFTIPTLAKVGCPVTGFDDYPVDVGWDIRAAAEQLTCRPWTAREFWSMLDYNHWANLPYIGEWLIDLAVKLVGKSNVCILTSPTLDPQCAAGKVAWIQKHLPNWLHRQFLIGSAKRFCAGPGSVLIDDRDSNIYDFYTHGGKAVLVPRPWNTGAYRLDGGDLWKTRVASDLLKLADPLYPAFRTLKQCGLIPEVATVA